MEASKTLPGQYHLQKTIQFSQGKAVILTQLIAIPLFFVYLVLFFLIARSLQPTLWSGSFTIERPFLVFAIGFVLLVGQIVLHELLHGVCFWYFTKTRPIFGFRWAYAYAGAPDWYLPRNQFMMATLAPFVVITVMGLPLLAFASMPVVIATLLVIIVNATGSLGDHYVAILLMGEPQNTFCNDTGTKITFYRANSPLTE